MISSSYFFIAVVLMSIVTFSIRGSIIFFSSRFTINERSKELFSFIPAALLPALVSPLVFFHKGQWDLILGKERSLVLVASIFFWLYSRSMLATILFGLASLYLIYQLIP